MFFSKLSLIAAAAFGAFSSALPIDTPLSGLPVDPSAVTGVVSGVVGDLPAVGSLPVVGSLPIDGLVPRDLPSLAAVLTGLQTELAPVTQALTFVTSQNATVEALQGPVHQIVSILGGATATLGQLVGQDASIILASVDGTVKLTVAEVATLLVGVLTIVLEAVGAVLKVAGPAIDHLVFELLQTVGTAVFALLSIVLKLVGALVVDLLAILVPLIKDLIPFILQLNIAELLTILGL